MTTVNRTNEPTAEQILVDEWIRQADRSRSMTGMDAIWFPDAKETLAALRDHGLLSEGAPSDDAVRDAVDHVRGAVEFQDAISPEAVRVLTDAVILARPLIQDPAVTALVAEAREWAKYDSTGASKIVIELCAALTATGVAPQEPNQNETKSGNNFVSLDPEKVAEVERAAAVRALEEAADGIESRRNEPGLVHLDVRYAGYYTGIRSGMESDSKALRVRAAEIREGESE